MEWPRGRACCACMLPVPAARLRPRGAREHLASAGAGFAGGVKRVVRFVVNVIGVAFGF